MGFYTQSCGEINDWRRLAAGLRIAVAGAVALTTLGLLSGCSSFFSGSSSGSHVAYVAGGQTAVSAWRIGNNSGSVTSLLSAPYVAGNSPSSVVIHPSGQFLYVANALDSTISLFSINSTSGALTEVLPRSPAVGLSPGSMTVDGGGSFLFVANQGSNDIWTFQIGTGGALTPVSSVSVAASPAGLVLTSSGLLYVPVPNFSTIDVFSVSSGTLTPVGQPILVNGGLGGIAVDSGAKFLYATNPSTATVSGFSIQPGGSLIAVPGLTFGTGAVPVAAAVDLTGSFLYVANSGAGSISQFKIDSSTGALTAFLTTTVTVGTNPGFVVIDPGGKFVFVGNTGSKSATELIINSNGSLTNTTTIDVGFVPRSLALTN
jgi:6-phosphogluconolactonase